MVLFDPITEEYVEKQSGLLEKGEYEGFTTLQEHYGKYTGEFMFKLIAKIRESDGGIREIIDYLPLKGKFVHKTRHYFKAVGRLDVIEKGVLENFSEFKDIPAKMSVYIGEDQNGKKQNKIDNFFPSERKGAQFDIKKKTTDLDCTPMPDDDLKLEDDDIPF
jgi:hypothetical protein